MIVAVVWWFACYVAEKKEMKRKRVKKIEMMILYMMNIYCDVYIILLC